MIVKDFTKPESNYAPLVMDPTIFIISLILCGLGLVILFYV